MSARRKKPHDPGRAAKQREEAERQQARQRRAEEAQWRADGVDPKIARWGDDPMDTSRVEALERQGFEVVPIESDAAKDAGRSTVAHDHRGRMVKASHKADIWQQLYARSAAKEKLGQQDGARFTKAMLGAVRDLQDLMAKRAGLGGRDEKMAYARDKADEPFRDPCLVNKIMLDAAFEIELTLEKVGPPSSRLLKALLEPKELSQRATMQRPMRRCGATAERELAAPANGAGPSSWDQAVRDFEDRKRGRTTPRTVIERRVCEALNEIDAKRCQGCGAAMPEDVQNEKGEIIARPGVEMLAVEEDWRAIVARTSGCTRKESQGELLRFAAQALVDVRPQVQAAMKHRRDASKRADDSAQARRDPQGLAIHPFQQGGALSV